MAYFISKLIIGGCVLVVCYVLITLYKKLNNADKAKHKDDWDKF